MSISAGQVTSLSGVDWVYTGGVSDPMTDRHYLNHGKVLLLSFLVIAGSKCSSSA